MNIAAYIAACDVWDLDRNAKDALRAVCGRADHPTGVADVPIGRIAADMGVHYVTARRALVRVVEAGYLAVDNRAGRPQRWQVNLATLGRDLPRDTPRDPGSRPPRDPGSRTKDLLDIRGGAAAPPSPGGRAGDNPAHPGSCQCQGTGWVDADDGTVARCTVTPQTQNGSR